MVRLGKPKRLGSAGLCGLLVFCNNKHNIIFVIMFIRNATTPQEQALICLYVIDIKLCKPSGSMVCYALL